MAIPKQVEQQMKEVEDMEKAMQAPPEGEQTAATTDPEPQAAPVNDAPGEAERPPEPVRQVTDDEWQVKYQTLRGKYDAEVPRLYQQNKELAQQVAQLQVRVEDLAKPKQESSDERLLTDQDESAFGPELIDMVRRATKEATRDMQKSHSVEVNSLQAKIQDLESRLSHTSGDVSTLTFEQRLNRVVPDFDKLNVDPKWISWLNETDPYTGQPRMTYAEYQYSQGNVAEVKRIVDLYRATSGDGTKPETQQRQKELARQVQPSRTASSTATPSSAKFYTEADASRLFDRVRQLNMQGKQDEAASLEAELTNAYVQGRVRG